MIISGLGLLLGGQADPRSVRRGSERARRGRPLPDRQHSSWRQIVQEAGGQLDDDELIVAPRMSPRQAAPVPYAWAAPRCLPASARSLTATLVRIHGQAEQERLTEADRQRQLLDRFAWRPGTRNRWRATRVFGQRIVRRGRSWLTLRAEAQRRAREIDLLRFGLDEIETDCTCLRRGCRAGSRGAAAAVRRRSSGFGRVGRTGARWAR